MARRRMIFGKVERLLIAGLLCLSFWLFSLRIPGNRVLQYMERFVMHDDGRYLLSQFLQLLQFSQLTQLKQPSHLDKFKSFKLMLFFSRKAKVVPFIFLSFLLKKS